VGGWVYASETLKTVYNYLFPKRYFSTKKVLRVLMALGEGGGRGRRDGGRGKEG